jgi:Spy/CpxP family protein refolding chaperone
MRDGDNDWLAGPMMRGLARKLDLTDKQRQELATIHKDREAKLSEWNDSHPDATWQDRLTFRRDQFDASIEAFGNILTPEQNAKLNELSAKQGKMGFGRRAWGQGPGMFMRQLDLTKDQQEQLETLREQHRAAAKAWHEANPNATPEQRRAFREAHRKGMEASLKNVLTEDQMAKLKSLRDHHRGGPAWDNPDDAGDEPGEN